MFLQKKGEKKTRNHAFEGKTACQNARPEEKRAESFAASGLQKMEKKKVLLTAPQGVREADKER